MVKLQLHSACDASPLPETAERAEQNRAGRIDLREAAALRRGETPRRFRTRGERLLSQVANHLVVTPPVSPAGSDLTSGLHQA
jgi:hypothetical protein